MSLYVSAESSSESEKFKPFYWLLMLLYFAFMGSMFVVILLSTWIDGRGIVDIRQAQNHPLDLVGVPGDTIRLKLFEGESPRGAWASSDGFYLKLRDQEPGQEIVIPVLSPTEFKGLSDVIL